GPSTWTSARNEWPCSRAHLCPSGTFGSRWAASNPNSVNTSIRRSRDADELVGLQAEAPAGMRQAVGHGGRGGGVAVGPVAGLEEEAGEVEVLVVGGSGAVLGEHQLELVAPPCTTG